MVSQLGKKYFCRWIGCNFFGELRLLSSLRLEVLGWLQIETVFDHVTISNNMILLCMLLYKWKQINYFLLSLLFSFIQFLGGQTIFNTHFHPAFLLQRGCGTYHFSSRASTADKTCSHRPPFQNQFPDQRVKGVMRTSGEIDFRFRLNLKLTLVELTYPSQRPQCPSLSPHFLLGLFILYMFQMSYSFPFGNPGIQFEVLCKQKTKGAFLWDGLDQNQWYEISRIIIFSQSNYRQRQINQSDCEISGNCGKNHIRFVKWKHEQARNQDFMWGGGGGCKRGQSGPNFWNVFVIVWSVY